MKSEYAARVRSRLKSSDNALGRPLFLREVAERLGYSYEHVRQAVLGRPVGSRKFSNELAKLCALDPEDMWRIATREKAARRYGVNLARSLEPPPDRRMVSLWGKLTDSERSQLVAIAEGLLARREHRRRA